MKQTKKTCLLFLLLFISGGISAQIMVEYSLQRLLIYHPKCRKNKQHLLLEKLPLATTLQPQQNSFQKEKKAYMKAYANYKKEPKPLFHDSTMQQNFLYNIEVISLIFAKYSFLLDPNDSQEEAISHALYQLIDIMKNDVDPEKLTPQLFEKVNGIFETLDDNFYQLLIEWWVMNVHE